MNCIYHGPVTAKRTLPLRVDLPFVLEKKIGSRRTRMIPRFLMRTLEKIICVKEINQILAHNQSKTGAEFATGVLRQLNIKVNVRQQTNLPSPENRRVLFICNHPMGGAEGIAMIHFMHQYYGGQIYVMVNDILMAIEPLQSVFVPVNKHGHQGHQTLTRIEDAMKSDNPVLIFPAGMVSRLDDKGRVRDLPWSKTFITKAIEHKRTVIPMFCCGRNSMFFYRFAKLRKNLGFKLNIEMVRLPREVLRMSNRAIDMICGKPVAWQSLRGGRDAREETQRLRELVYAMEPVAQ